MNQLALYAKGLTSKASQMLFGYDALKDRGKRQSTSGRSVKQEELECKASERRKLVATQLDQFRNFSLVRFACQKHLDYCTQFQLVSQTGIKELDERIEWLWSRYKRAKNCHLAGQHSLDMIIRLWDLCKLLNGDSGILLADGGKLQIIEGNRVALPGDLPEKLKTKIGEHGCEIDKNGKILNFCVCKRDNNNTLQYDTLIDSEFMVWGGYYFRNDQVRAVSPIASCLNTLQDLYESYEYQLIKAKLHALWGVVITSDAVTSVGGFGDKKVIEDDTSTDPKYTFDLTPGKPFKVELDKGEDAKPFESNTPSAEFTSYSRQMIRLALSALDIPLSFYDADGCNWAGRKFDLIEYQKSCEWKRANNREALERIFDWKIEQFIVEDETLAKLLRDNKLEAQDIRYGFVSVGDRYMDEYAEAQAALLRVNGGLSSRKREVARYGLDWQDIVTELANEEATIKESGISVTTGQPGQPNTTDKNTTSADTANEEVINNDK